VDPLASFTASRTLGYKPLTVSFTDRSTSHDGVVQWAWTLGDGATSQDANPSHTYLAEGHYTVTLTIRERDGDEATATQTIRVLGNDAEPPTIHDVYHYRTADNIILEALVVDNSDIKSVTVYVPGYRTVAMRERPELPWVYKATLPRLNEATVTILAEDYNGNRAERSWALGSGETRTCLNLKAGWNSVEVPNTISFIEFSDLANALSESSDRLGAYQEALGITGGFQEYRIISLWAYDEYRGYLFYDLISGYGDLERIEGGRSYWVEVTGASFNPSPLEVYVVYR